MINKTYLPHTYENQSVLREYGQKISDHYKNPDHLNAGPSTALELNFRVKST
jgi:hypothetical protein